MAKSKLTDKQEVFCLEYLKDLNASQSALRAGYSPKTAKDIGAENLSKPNIQARIAELMKERTEKIGYDADWVLKEAAESYQFNKQEVYDQDGNPKMVNAAAAGKFLELVGKHTDVRAFDTTENNQQQPPISISIVNPHVDDNAD